MVSCLVLLKCTLRLPALVSLRCHVRRVLIGVDVSCACHFCIVGSRLNDCFQWCGRKQKIVVFVGSVVAVDRLQCLCCGVR